MYRELSNQRFVDRKNQRDVPERELSLRVGHMKRQIGLLVRDDHFHVTKLLARLKRGGLIHAIDVVDHN